MSRVQAVERVQRILSILPWIVANPGCEVDEVCERFLIDRKSLLDDLDFVFYNVGIFPFTPDVLADVSVDDDVIYVTLGDYFQRPLALNPAETLTLLTSAKAALRLDSNSKTGPHNAVDDDSALRSAVQKLEASLGMPSAGALDVKIAELDSELADVLKSSVAARHRLEISYYSFGKDHLSERTVEPWRLIHKDGHWYLRAWCETAGGPREFRLDRIYGVRELGIEFAHRPEEDLVTWSFDTRMRTVVITGSDDIEWIARSYPVDSAERLADGDLRIEVPVATQPWLERLVLRLPVSARIEDRDTGEDLSWIRVETARRVLQRYGIV